MQLNATSHQMPALAGREWIVALCAGVAGASSLVLSGPWRSGAGAAGGVPSELTARALVFRTALVVVVAVSFLVLSTADGQRVAARLVAPCSNRDGHTSVGALLRVLVLPLALWIAVLGWAASAGQHITPYALAYGALLIVPALLVSAWPMGRVPQMRLSDVDAPSTDATARVVPFAWPLPLLIGVVVAMWLPIELALLPPLPRVGTVGVSVEKFVAVVAGLWLFLIVRPLPAIGYGLRLDALDVCTALIGFFGFAAIALPLGFAVTFLVWNPRADLALYFLRPVLIYFTIALPEEFVFRGILQRALTDRLRFGPALVIAAAVFGIAHAPSVPYIVLATIAGVAYGWVYQRTGRVAAAALTHALVDAVWILLLRR